MATRAEKGPPKGLLRMGLRFPILIYRARCGWLLGQRFLMLTHTGRTSGLARHVVLEVVEHDEASDAYFIASGWGEKSDWLQNLEKTPRVTVDVGARRFETEARRLDAASALAVLEGYGRRHPAALRKLAQFMLGEDTKDAAKIPEKLAAVVPLVRLQGPGR
jgi:deazaflavin-dependent oxidoreductase (nitroreductase family)